MGTVSFWGRPMQQQPSAVAPSPERERLASAIAAKRADDAQRAALKQAYSEAERRVFRQRDVGEAAAAALEQAKSGQAAHLIAEASGRSEPAPVSIRAARAALTDAEDELAGFEAARAVLKDNLADAAQRPEYATTRVRAAALAVIRAEGQATARALVDEVEQLQQQLIRRGEALRWLAREARAFPLGDRPGIDFDQVLDPRVAAVLKRAENLSRAWSNLWPDQAAGRAPWLDTLAALEADAAAALPGTS